MADTEQFVSRVLEKGGGLVRPILTPRYRMMMMINDYNDDYMMMSPGLCRPARGG